MLVQDAQCVGPADTGRARCRRAEVVLASRRNQNLIAAGLFGLLPFALYVHLWWPTGHQTLGMDYLWARPGQQLLFMQAVRDGFYPLWAPADAGGIPFASYLCAGQYWPVTWLMMALDITYEGLQVELLTVMRLFSLGMSGFFTYLLARRLGLGLAAGLCAGVVFIFNFRMLDAFRYGFELDTVVWLPVIVYLMDLVVARPYMWLVVALAVANYVAIAAGHTQSAVYCIVFANAYLIVRMLALVQGRHRRERLHWLGRRVMCAVAGQAITAGMCAVMVLPLLSDVLLTWTDRTLGGAAYRAQGHMTWQGLVSNLFYPWLANVHSGFYGSQAAWLLIAVTAGGLISGWSRYRRQDRILMVFLFATVLLAIAYALGPLTPLREGIDALSPGFVRMFRNPGRVMVPGMFAMALLAACAIDGILHDDRLKRVAGRILTCGSAVYLAAGLALALAVAVDAVDWQPKRISLPVLGDATGYTPAAIHDDPTMLAVMAAVIICVAAANLLTFTLWRRGRLSAASLIACLIVIVSLETHIYHRRGTWLVEGRFHTPASAIFRNADIYHTRTFHPLPFYVRVGSAVRPTQPGGPLRVSQEAPGRIKELLTQGGVPAWRIYHLTVTGHEIPRAYLTPAVTLARGDGLAAMARMNPCATSVIDLSDPVNARASTDPGIAALAAGPQDEPPAVARARFDRINHGVKVIEYTFNRATFRVSTEAPALFNYSDRYADGWRAKIGDHEIPLYRGNHAFKALALPPGDHTIALWYDPPSFRRGLLITLASVCALAGIGGGSIARRAGKRRVLLGAVAAISTLPLAWMIHDGVYSMAFRPGMINLDPNAPRQAFPDYEDYLATGRIGPIQGTPHTRAPSDRVDEQPAVPSCAGRCQP